MGILKYIILKFQIVEVSREEKTNIAIINDDTVGAVLVRSTAAQHVAGSIGTTSIRSEQIFAWPAGCCWSGCFCMCLFHVCKRTHVTGNIHSVGESFFF